MNLPKFLVFIGIFITTSLAASPVEIIFWHSLAGNLGENIHALAHRFNDSQKDYLIKPVYKGDYIESLTSFAAAFRVHRAPALIQVFEVGTATMLNPAGIIKPAYELMQEQGLALKSEDFFPAINSYYSKTGKLMAMPLNISLPLMFYNADALARLGYDDKSFPKTWDELEILASKLHRAGFACAYTTAYPAWILIESFIAIHNLPMLDLSGKRAVYNNKELVAHLKRLLRWQQLHYFEYGGRADDATILFTSGRCPLYTQSSGSYSSLAKSVSFRLGIASIPLDNKASIKRYNNVTGGAALWISTGQSQAIYKGIAKFFEYLTQTSAQLNWHQDTGYLPLGISGNYKSLTLTSHHPVLLLAQSEWMHKLTNTQTPSFGAQHQIRIINDEALESIFAGIKTPQLAIDAAVVRANHALLRFARNNTHV